MKSNPFIAATLIAVLCATNALAQYAVPPPAPYMPVRGPAELDQLLGPIALYPDPLIAQILPASTSPAEIVMAARYIRLGGDPGQIDYQYWSVNVKAVAHYPDVLRMMDERLDWTTQLGQAFIAQQADVMNSIQRLRMQAQMLGNLVSTPQQMVVAQNGIIEIVPAQPQMIYVPTYRPDYVFVRRAPPSGFFMSFGAGFSLGLWLNQDCDWRHRDIIVWHRDHPRPHDWYHRPYQERFAPTVIVKRDVTVWRPHTTVVAPRQDRGWSTHEVRREPGRVEVHRAEPAHREPVRVEPSREIRRVEPAHRDATPEVRRAPSPSPFVGIQSGAREVREYSTRGQQSREQIVVKPAPGRPAPPKSDRDRDHDRR